MSFLSGGVAKGHERQKQSLINEATAAGCQILQIEEFGSETSARGSAISSSLKSMVGGKLAPDTFHVFLLGTGASRLLYVQPYSGMTVLPGEHHGWLQGAFRSPLALTDEAIFGGPAWKSGADTQLAEWLNKQNPVLKQVTKKCEFEWAIGMSKIELQWAVQVLSMGNGCSHVILQTGRYGGFTTYEVGFGHFLALLGALAPLLPQNTEPQQEPHYPVSFTELFASYVLGVVPAGVPEATPAATEEPASVPTMDAQPPDDVAAPSAEFSERIRTLVSPLVGKKIHVDELPPKKEANARKVVMKGADPDEPIVALFDLTTFGSAKNAVVFTPTHLYAFEIDDRAVFALADLKQVHGLKGLLDDKIKIEVRGQGKLKVPCGTQGEQLLSVLQGLLR
jgi:hypothetical protein